MGKLSGLALQGKVDLVHLASKLIASKFPRGHFPGTCQALAG